jgi:ribosome-binding protein aMBF1 (putative translation factor)
MVGPWRLEPDLYRVNVKQPLQDQQRWLQVVDSAFNWMGQIGPIVRAMGHKGPKFCDSLGRVLSQLGNTLRTARLHRGWSLEDLASACGFSTAYLAAVEGGQADPSILAIAILFDALGLAAAHSISPADDQA